MAYSNVTPPALPVFDTTAYPNYVLVFNYYVGATDWYEVHLMASASAFYYDTAAGYATINETSHLRYEISARESEWTEWGAVEAAPTIKPGQTAQIYQRIYTNHDILDTAGKVWLAADSITPVEDTRDLRSHVLGIVLALIQKALSPIRKQPTAYLYNGVQLPPLPEWDREMYPYAAILCNESKADYWIYAFSKTPFLFNNENGALRNVDNSKPYSYITLIDGVWGEWRVITYTMEFFANCVAKWCNYPIYDSDGTLYLSASDPIPVYE